MDGMNLQERINNSLWNKWTIFGNYGIGLRWRWRRRRFILFIYSYTQRYIQANIHTCIKSKNKQINHRISYQTTSHIFLSFSSYPFHLQLLRSSAQSNTSKPHHIIKSLSYPTHFPYSIPRIFPQRYDLIKRDYSIYIYIYILFLVYQFFDFSQTLTIFSWSDFLSGWNDDTISSSLFTRLYVCLLDTAHINQTFQISIITMIIV